MTTAFGKPDNQLRAPQQLTEVRSSRALWWGIAFSFAFTALIWLVRPLLPQIDFAPDTGYSHYYWKLPDPTFWSRASAWAGYLGHQVALWYLIYYAQKNGLRYTDKLHPVNIWALAVNAFFIVLHLVQTTIWYDGLAQDVSIFSSQGSVILLLVMVLLMENQRRGLFFGKKISWLKQPAGVVRTYHGYVFAWAAVYTFWYHPMEATSGHLIGFLYTFFLLLQGSLFFTRVHLNKYWMFAQEGMVLVHGTLVAVMNATRGGSTDIWAMFFFGFAALFVVTQMYGLGLPRWVRWAIIATFIALVTIVYNGRWVDTNEILRIPVIEYALVFVLAGLIMLGTWLRNGWRRLMRNSGGREPISTDRSSAVGISRAATAFPVRARSRRRGYSRGGGAQ